MCFAIWDVAGKDKLDCAIFGKTDASIAETATFFWSLKYSEESKVRLETCVYGFSDKREFDFDFAALTAEQLGRILDANPKRHFTFQTGIWRAELSAVLATRSYPLKLTLTKSDAEGGGFVLEDNGTAFVDALEKRQSSFGSLSIEF